MNNIGTIYKAKGDKDNALEMFQKAMKIDDEIKDTYGKATRLNNIGGIYMDKGDLKNALKNFEIARDLFIKLGVKSELEIVKKNISAIKNKKTKIIS